MTLSVGSLFLGIGGLELGLERAGMRVAWQVEIDPFCRDILAQHWPDVPRLTDVRSPETSRLPTVDLVCGGFPCQDLSHAGKRAGLDGARSGLWIEFRRIVGALRPRWVVIENVQHAWRSWVPFVRGDLWALGYASLPVSLRASDFGAPYHRARTFVLADSFGILLREQQRGRGWASRTGEVEPPKPGPKGFVDQAWQWPTDCHWWVFEPNVARVVPRAPRTLDRAAREKALGNCVVPQLSEYLGRVIVDLDSEPL